MREKKKSKNDRIIHELGPYISDITPIAEMIEELIWFLNSQYDFFEELPFADCIYSFDSPRRLHEPTFPLFLTFFLLPVLAAECLSLTLILVL